MKTRFFLIILLLISLQPAFSQNSEKNFIDQNFIEVTGTSEMEIIPDEIQITISVSEKDFKTKQAFDDYEKQVLAKFKEIGISVENDFSIMNMNSNLKVSVLGSDKIYFTKKYMVVVHNTETANKVFNEMEKIGVNNITITKYDHSEIEKYRLDVKTDAIKAAKVKAEKLTTAIGQSIGKALYINEVNHVVYQPNYYGNSMYLDANQMEYDKVEKVNFQKIKLSYSILVRFELK
jgi:uncharacterized protein YggE